MKKTIATVICVSFLTACAFETLDKGLPLFEGQKIDRAVEYLGPPDQKQVFGDKNYYSWMRSVNTSITMPVQSQSSGYVGGSYYSGNTTTYQNMPATYECKIQFETNSDNVIQKANYEGNLGGCEYYAPRIEGFIKSQSQKDSSVVGGAK